MFGIKWMQYSTVPACPLRTFTHLSMRIKHLHPQDSAASGAVLCAGQLLQLLEEDSESTDWECSILRHLARHLCHTFYLPGCRQEDCCFVSHLYATCTYCTCITKIALLSLSACVMRPLMYWYAYIEYTSVLLIVCSKSVCSYLEVIYCTVYGTYYLPPFSENLPSLLATASNTWGLLILTLLLGYGLVEVPRSVSTKVSQYHSSREIKVQFLGPSLILDIWE